jgi:hypothetical protein
MVSRHKRSRELRRASAVNFHPTIAGRDEEIIAAINHRPRVRLTKRQRTLVLEQRPVSALLPCVISGPVQKES